MRFINRAGFLGAAAASSVADSGSSGRLTAFSSDSRSSVKTTACSRPRVSATYPVRWLVAPNDSLARPINTLSTVTPWLSGQLRRQSHQGFADLFPASRNLSGPYVRQWYMPRRLQRTRHSLHVVGHPSRHRCLRSAGVFGNRDVRLHLGTSAVLAAKALCRRSPRLVAGSRRSRISCVATDSSSATVPEH